MQEELVSSAAEEAVRFMSEVQGALGGLTREMFEDPFVVGAVAMHSAITLKVMSKGQAPSALVELAMVEGLERTFSALDVRRHEVVGALLRFKNNPEYAKGVQVASLILGARYERKDMQFDPLIVDARASMASMPLAFRKEFGATDAEQVAYELAHRHFIRPLRARYGELWRGAGNT